MSGRKLYFCVVKDWSGNWSVSSFGGRNRKEEALFARSGYQQCILITENHDAAQRCAADARRLDAEHAKEQTIFSLPTGD